MNYYDLTKLGLTLLDETGKCPLCDTEWPKGELKIFLESKLSLSESAEKYKRQLEESSIKILNETYKIIPSISNIKDAADKIKFKNNTLFRKWLEDINSLTQSINKAIQNYSPLDFNQEQFDKAFIPEKVEEVISEIIQEVRRLNPKISPELTAWDTLTRLEENLKVLENAENTYNSAIIPTQRAGSIHDLFLQSRDEVLSELYDNIRDRFVGLYRAIHKIDESQFSATIQPDRAGLDFEVDFYGRGIHPPHALHSEGHQDSMGLCLYLALSEKLNEGLIDLTILDDVMMSVDADHRRQICSILATSFQNRQFLITTHDKTWANQLKGEGVVSLNEFIEFYDWNVDTGPKTNQGFEVWQKINDDLEQKKIPEAAAKLRRGSEEFFASVCDALKAPVVYNLNHRWELGDYIFPAMDIYSHYLKKAINAEKSWGENEKEKQLIELDSQRVQIYSRVKTEQWAINANVHYNNWANFTFNDFQPVAEAFEDLWGLFKCHICGDLLRVTTTNNKPKSIQCRCGAVNWNLTPKNNFPAMNSHGT